MPHLRQTLIRLTHTARVERKSYLPLPKARSRIPFQSELTVSGVAAFMPAVLAADCTVLELAAPGRPGFGVNTHNGPSSPRTAYASTMVIGQLILVVAVTPPDDYAIDSGIIVLVDQFLTGQFLDLGADRVVHIVVPQPFLYQVAGLETEFFSVIRCRLVHVRQYTNTARTYTLRTLELLTVRDCIRTDCASTIRSPAIRPCTPKEMSLSRRGWRSTPDMPRQGSRPSPH